MTHGNRTIFKLVFLATLSLLLVQAVFARADVSVRQVLLPGKQEEQSNLIAGDHTVIDGDSRVISSGGWSLYRISILPTAKVVIRLTGSGEPKFQVLNANSQPVAFRIDRGGLDQFITFTAPVASVGASNFRLRLDANLGEVRIQKITIDRIYQDRMATGLGDPILALMGLMPGQKPHVYLKPPKPHSSFQTTGSYDPAFAPPTDIVYLYSSDREAVSSWLDKGYSVYYMSGFRETKELALTHPGEIQTDQNGKRLSIGEDSVYMVPTLERNLKSAEKFKLALQSGLSGIVPEEPEFFSSAGYSEAFKQEWQRKYGQPWREPNRDMESRNQSEKLKAELTRNQMETIFGSVAAADSKVTRMLAVHSPVTYPLWGITAPLGALSAIPSVQEIIGQVWMGTARSPVRTAGVRTERIFELAYLEYSSLVNLVRGLDKKLWFLIDPVDDTPGRKLEEYNRGYMETMLASMMFPQVDSFEVMPWPRRIYGTVPAGYATVVNTVSGVLSDLWRDPKSTLEAGNSGIGIFYSDSMGQRREQPNPTDLDGFFALAMPLIAHGVPVQCLSLERSTDAGYLDKFKVLLLSYEYLKPASAAVNTAIADWTRKGGSLLVFGGDDPYNRLADNWWRASEYDSPTAHLFVQMGLQASRAVVTKAPDEDQFVDVLRGDKNERNLLNRRKFQLDLTPYVTNGSAKIKFADSSPENNWGASLFSVEMRINGNLAAAFRTGSELETRFLVQEAASGFNGAARFADGTGSWIYRFDNLPVGARVELTLDMGNSFLVQASKAGPRGSLMETSVASIDKTVRKVRLPSRTPISSIGPPNYAIPIFVNSESREPIITESKVGLGRMLYAALNPSIFSLTAQNSKLLRELVKHSLERTGQKYAERAAMTVTRGAITGVKTLGRELEIEGLYVNLLSPTLAVEEDPTIRPRSWALLKSFVKSGKTPKILATSGRVVVDFEQTDLSSWIVKAPSGTEGVTRILRNGKSLAGARAYTMGGDSVAVTTYADGDTILLRYDNRAEGIILKVGWK